MGKRKEEEENKKIESMYGHGRNFILLFLSSKEKYDEEKSLAIFKLLQEPPESLRMNVTDDRGEEEEEKRFSFT